MKISNTTLIQLQAVPGGTAFGEQATLRGRKVLAILAVRSFGPGGTPVFRTDQAFITLVNSAGRIIHENLSLEFLSPNVSAGLIRELGSEVIDWTKSTVKANGLVCFSVVYE